MWLSLLLQFGHYIWDLQCLHLQLRNKCIERNTIQRLRPKTASNQAVVFWKSLFFAPLFNIILAKFFILRYFWSLFSIWFNCKPYYNFKGKCLDLPWICRIQIYWSCIHPYWYQMHNFQKSYPRKGLLDQYQCPDFDEQSF